MSITAQNCSNIVDYIVDIKNIRYIWSAQSKLTFCRTKCEYLNSTSHGLYK